MDPFFDSENHERFKHSKPATPYTPKRDAFNSSFESRGGTASASKMVEDVIAELDRQVESRKRELTELLRSRSASKKRTAKKPNFTPIRNTQLDQLLSPNAVKELATKELAKDLAKLTHGHEFPMIGEDKNGCESPIDVYDVSNIHDDLDVEDATIKFGSSVYDHVHLAIHSPVFDMDGKEELDSILKDPAIPLPGRAARVETKQRTLQGSGIFDEEKKELPSAIIDEESSSSPLTAKSLDMSTSQLLATSQNASQLLRSWSQEPRTDRTGSGDQSHLGSGSQRGGKSPALLNSFSDVEKSLGSSFHTLNQAEIETYKMKYNTVLLKYNILRNDFEKITERLQVLENDSSSAISDLKATKAKLEHERMLLEEDYQGVKEELLFVRGQLQSKSARVTDLEAELLMSHKFASSLQQEMQNLLASPPTVIQRMEADPAEVFQLRQRLEEAAYDLSRLSEENQKIRKYNADYHLDKNQMVAQIEELERRVRESDSSSFELEVRMSGLEETNEKLKELVMDKQQEIDDLALQLEKEKEQRRKLREESSLVEKRSSSRPARERIVFLSRDNQKAGKIGAWKFQQKFPLSRLLVLIAGLQLAVWVLLLSSAYLYMNSLDYADYFHRITS